MDRIQQTHVDQVSRDFANLQQNGAFDAQAGSPQYVQDTQHMYTPHPLDRNAQGDSRSGAASASAKPTAGSALYPAADNHASSSMADNQPLVPVAYQSQMFQAFGAARQNIHSAAWNGSPLQDQSTAAAPAWQHLCSRVNRCLRENHHYHNKNKPTHAVRHHRRCLCGLATATRGQRPAAVYSLLTPY